MIKISDKKFIKETLPKKLIYLIFAFLLVIMPLNNIIGQYLTKSIGLNSVVLLYKEVLMVILGLIFILKTKFQLLTKIHYFPLISIILLNILGVYSVIINKVPLGLAIIGYRFELFWITILGLGIIFIITNPDYLKEFNVLKYINIGFILVSINSILSLVVGPRNYYPLFGFNDNYSGNGDNTINSPICHIIDASVGGCRLSGGFNNPNHFAGYLLLVLPILIYQIVVNQKVLFKFIFGILALANLYFIYLIFSRYAIIGIFICFMVLGLFVISKKTLFKPFIFCFIALILIANVLISSNLSHVDLSSLPSTFAKVASTNEHIKYTSNAIDIIQKDFPSNIISGYGLSSAGTVAKTQYQDVTLTNYYKTNQQVFVRNQVNNENSGNPENWFLQLILNGGIMYALIYTLLLLYPTLINNFSIFNFNIPVLAGLLPILFANTVLHIFESSTVVIYIVILTLCMNYKSEIAKVY